MTNFVIYCHTHIASGKRYVGQTRLGLMKRWANHDLEIVGAKPKAEDYP
jgi:hypothetical protein